MQIRFWGTRGSIAKPGSATARYGGNTSCVEVRSDSGTLIVIDCGTGGHSLGQHLITESGGKINGNILVSHTHWDHIQGIPFFAPLFIAGNVWDIYGPKGLSQSLRTTLAGQMEHTYFPITLDQFAATIHYHDLVEGAFTIEDVGVTTRYLNHPALTLGYRLDADGASVVYCCDHEPHSTVLASGDLAITGADQLYADFINNADLVIHDAQYTSQEYSAKVGWGHSTAEYAVRICRDSGVKRLVLTHHDPLRDDAAIDQIVENMRSRLIKDNASLQVIAAKEGQSIRVSGDSDSKRERTNDRFLAKTAIDTVSITRPVMIFASDSQLIALLSKAATDEELPFQVIADKSILLRRIIEEQPSLVIVEHNPPYIKGEETARAIRQINTGDLVKVPIVLVTTIDHPTSQKESVATEWLVLPFSPSYIRTKIRAWVLRTACRWIRAQISVNENRRLKALHDLAILDTPPEERFDRITRIASAAFDVPIALVSLVDSDRQWFKSCYGLKTSETPRDAAFCSHVVHLQKEMVVSDTLLDDRFADNPLVLEEPRIRFYAGAPLILDDGDCIGTLCLIDTRPRELNQRDLATLRDLRDLVLQEIKHKRV